MNAQAGLPEALANRQRRVSVSDDATQGLGISRGAHCSIRAARFRLIDANGVETLVPNLHLDVVIIRANPKTSKLYFDGSYAPDSGTPPACYSDNGIGPSSNALRPQSPTCSACPHNQMNSKVNPQTGKGSKACSDRKKIAFIIPGDVAVNVYELQVPPDSLGALKSYSSFLSQQATGGQRKVDIGDMVTRLSFDAEASHPKLKFEPVGWADDTHTLQMIDYIYDQQLDVAAVGLNDVPADPDLVKQAIELRAQYAQLAPQSARPAQFQLPRWTPPPAQDAQQVSPGNGAAPEQVAPKPRGRPRKASTEAAGMTPIHMVGEPAAAPQFSPPTPATPVHMQRAPDLTPGGLPDIPEFLRRPAANTAPPPAPPAQPQPAITPQYGMAAAPPPPPQVAEALHAAMRMPPRR
jgi:hypothetical protein